jgi:hypothetical protein
MRVVGVAAATLLGVLAATSVAAQQPAPTPAPATGASQAPGLPPAGGAAAAQSAQPRTFTAPVGVLLNTVRADRVDDFEKAMGYLQSALAASTNERVRAQAAGWRIFKAAEAAPGGAVLYVFLLDPTVTGADYGLSRIFADAYPDLAKLQEIWKLYTGSVTGASLLNLTPVKAQQPTATKPAPPASTKPETPTTEKPLP